MSGGVIKRSIEIAGHRTSVTLEDAFWTGLRDIAKERNTSVRGLVADIDAGRGEHNLSSAVRLFVLAYYRDEASGATGRRRKSSGD
jgi:predicted DNA-binding ribbon-helix-helix protein